jgi:hypothetical protein
MKVQKHETSHRKSMLAAAVIAASFASAVSAAPVTRWTFSTDATFSNAVFTTDGTDPDRSTSASAYELSWGRDGADFENPVADFTENRSALTVGIVGDALGNGRTLTGGGPARGEVNTNTDGTPDLGAGEVGFGINLSHWNNPISSAFDTLTSGILTDTP